MERKYRFYVVKHMGITFSVEGDWEEYVPATKDEPAEGNCFYEYKIAVYGLEGEKDFTELLDSKVVEIIVSKAEQGLREL
jgi:hypothetical protein